MNSTPTRIQECFNAQFETWHITLPADDVRERRGGHIFSSGWHIGYVWGAAGNDEYLEILAQHRMTNDRHTRIYESGRIDELPAAHDFFSHPQDAAPEQIATAEREYFAHNARVNAELRARGLLPPVGANLPALEMNEQLRSGQGR